MIVRYEPWGAYVRAQSRPELVAIDREGARALGLDGGAAWSAPPPGPSAPLEVHLAVTARCAVGCDGCYLDARPDGDEPSREAILRALDAIRAAGVFTVAFGGGEPTLRDDLGDLAREATARGLVPVVTTSGIGLGPRKIEQLRAFAQVNVSYDGPGDRYEAVRGVSLADDAERAIERLAGAGVRVGVNIVLTRATFDDVPRTVARARDLGATEAQLLRYKPAGRAADLTYFARRLDPSQAGRVPALLRRLVETHSGHVAIRVDCALVPFLAADEAIAGDPRMLEQWGIFGCEAASALAAVRVDGRVAPCSFAEPAAAAVTDWPTEWGADPTLDAYRSFPARAPEPCASCTLASVCRGGCKIVSSFVAQSRSRSRSRSGPPELPIHAGELAPDPECPRVLAHARGGA